METPLRDLGSSSLFGDVAHSCLITILGSGFETVGRTFNILICNLYLTFLIKWLGLLFHPYKKAARIFLEA